MLRSVHTTIQHQYQGDDIMPLYQVDDETVKKLEAVAEALGGKYHDEANEI